MAGDKDGAQQILKELKGYFELAMYHHTPSQQSMQDWGEIDAAFEWLSPLTKYATLD